MRKQDPVVGKQKTLAHLLTRLAGLEPNVHQTGDVYLDTYRFYDALFSVIAHPSANSKTLRDDHFVTAFSHMLAQATQIAIENYKSDYRNVNVLSSAVLNNTAVIILRIHQQSPELLVYLLSACKVLKSTIKRILKAIDTHEQCLESTVSSMIADFANGRNVRLYFKRPKSRSAYANDQSRHYFDLLADFITGYEGMPLLTLKTLGLANAYIENTLAGDLAKDPKAAALIKQSIKSPSAMAKAAHWILERSQSKVAEFMLKMIYDRKPGLLPLATMIKRSKPIDHLRQDLGRYGDSCHMDYSMQNATTGHFELGFSTTEYHFSRYSPVLNECINGLRNALQQDNQRFHEIKSLDIVLRHIDILQTTAFAKAFRKLPTYKADLNVIRETPAMCYSAEILANNTPDQYEANRAGIEFIAIGKSARQNLPAIKMLPYDEQLHRIAETLCRFSDVLHQIAQQLEDNNEQALNLADFLVKNLEIISGAIENIRIANGLSENKTTAEAVASWVNKSIVNLCSIKQLILVGGWTYERMPEFQT